MILTRPSWLAPYTVAALVALAGCGVVPPAQQAPRAQPEPIAPQATLSPGERPRLVVLLVIDGQPQRQLTGYRDQFGLDGFNRFLERGAWFSEATYGHAATLTGPGHATILTGAYPNATGIIGNEWRDRATGRAVYCTADPAQHYLGPAGAGLEGTSPKNLLAETLGDVMRRTDARAKVIAISGKDRGAILLAGHAGTAYVYLPQTGQFASTTYYMKSHPAWVDAFNAAKPADRFFKSTWSPLLPEMAYARSVKDGTSWYARGGKLPKVMGEGQDAPGPRFYRDLLASPFVDELTLDFARAAIDAEALGQDEIPDLLAVSLSGHDYVNHAWSAESRLSHDHVLQLDERLAEFFRALDGRVGADRYVVVVTADHGFMPAPEFLRARGEPGGRQNPAQTLARLGAGLVARFGEGRWVLGWSAQGVLFDPATVARHGADVNAVADEAKRLLLQEPGIEAVFTLAEIESGAPVASPYLEAVRKSWHPGLSPDLQVLMKPGWMLSSYAAGTTHGSAHRYDTHVPILLYGPKWIRPGQRDSPVEVVDIAPTVAALLGVAAPGASQGRLLPLAP